MAKKITELTADTSPTSSDVMVMVDAASSSTKKVTVGNLFANIPAGSVETADIANGAVTAAKQGDSGWVPLTVVSPFTGQSDIAIRKVGSLVMMRGAFSRNSSFSTSQTTIATIPEGYRPTTSLWFPTSEGNFYSINLNTAGVFSAKQSAASAAFCAVSGFCWYVD